MYIHVTRMTNEESLTMYITQVVVQFFEEGLNSDKQSIKTIQTLFLWLNIPPHTKFH